MKDEIYIKGLKTNIRQAIKMHKQIRMDSGIWVLIRRVLIRGVIDRRVIGRRVIGRRVIGRRVIDRRVLIRGVIDRRVLIRGINDEMILLCLLMLLKFLDHFLCGFSV
jgi:hypothetical protein